MRDLVTIQRKEFYKWLPTLKTLPQTASPGPGDYLSIYQKLINEGFQNIISIHMTSKASGAYQAALAAKNMLLEMFPRINLEVIDTLNVSMCQGWMVIEAARDALLGKPLAKITNHIREMIPVTNMIQTADTLKYLHMGGRIGHAKHLVASLLDIKPLIGMRDGEIVALGQARSRQRAYKAIVDTIQEMVGINIQIKVAYVHAAACDEANKIKEMVEERLQCSESLIAELSPALGVHSGPGTAGVSFFPVPSGDSP